MSRRQALLPVRAIRINQDMLRGTIVASISGVLQ
jgi:hypothetical protein